MSTTVVLRVAPPAVAVRSVLRALQVHARESKHAVLDPLPGFLLPSHPLILFRHPCELLLAFSPLPLRGLAACFFFLSRRNCRRPPTSVVARKSSTAWMHLSSAKSSEIISAFGGLSDRCPQGLLLLFPCRYSRVCSVLRRSHHQHCADDRLLVAWCRHSPMRACPRFQLVEAGCQPLLASSHSRVRELFLAGPVFLAVASGVRPLISFVPLGLHELTLQVGKRYGEWHAPGYDLSEVVSEFGPLNSFLVSLDSLMAWAPTDLNPDVWFLAVKGSDVLPGLDGVLLAWS